MPTVASVLVLSLLSLPASPPRLRVDLVFEGLPIANQVERVAMKEVTAIWARYGVDVRASDPHDAVPDDAVRLAVVLGQHRGRAATDVLGSILFVDDSPRPYIRMYSDSISAIVSNAWLPGCGACEGSPLHDLVMARVLGRALAHEIGHYLLRSRRHSSAGLMRAHQPTTDLIKPDGRFFTLSGDEVMLLESHISTSSHPSSR